MSLDFTSTKGASIGKETLFKTTSLVSFFKSTTLSLQQSFFSDFSLMQQHLMSKSAAEMVEEMEAILSPQKCTLKANPKLETNSKIAKKKLTPLFICI